MGLRAIARRTVTRLGSRAIALPFVQMAIIFLLSSIPGGRKDLLGYTFELSPRLGDLLHFPAYYALGALWMISFESRGVRPPRSSILACALATLFGALDEVHQSFIPLRRMDVHDVIVDFLGALAAVATWPWLRPIFFTGRKGAPAPANAVAERDRGP